MSVITLSIDADPYPWPSTNTGAMQGGAVGDSTVFAAVLQ
jgi:hypothetical protein